MGNQTNGSANAGSPDDLIVVDPATGAGQSAGSGKGSDYQAMYQDLEKKLGTQGKELGEYRKFVESASPLLDKLEASPELVQAIMDGKIDGQLAKAALEGKISVADAAAVTAAHDTVRQELGDKKYAKASPEEITKLVTEQVESMRTEVTQKLEEDKQLRDYEKSIEEFITDTRDFDKYADKVIAWLDENPSQTDIRVAYAAVKGEEQIEKASKDGDVAGAEAAKRMALNAAGGNGSGPIETSDQSIVDMLVANRSNPNRF